jgi:nitroreductase
VSVADALAERKSIRCFTDRPVDQATIRQLVEMAQRSPSTMNSQAWKVYAVSGKRLDAVRESNVGLLRSNQTFDVQFPSELWPKDSVYRQRQVELAQMLYSSLGIARNDKERRALWFEQGFRYFDAPVVLFLAMDRSFPDASGRFDLGLFAQSLCLAALDHGLGSCINQQGIGYADTVARIIGVPESETLIISIALGYPDWSQPVNGVVSGRESIDDVLVLVT